jgi:hypothetical protein
MLDDASTSLATAKSHNGSENNSRPGFRIVKDSLNSGGLSSNTMLFNTTVTDLLIIRQ